jgi:ferric-dicitrate binding protein FerR (iron transport regulator)
MDEPDDTVTHPSAVALLDYVVGDLGADDSDAIRQHVRRCDECRDRIVALAAAMDELDRLPSVTPPGRSARRGPVARTVPMMLLVAAAIGVVALFQIGGLPSGDTAPSSGRVVLETASNDPAAVVGDLLGDIPHRVTVNRDDPRHLIVLVGSGDVEVTQTRIAQTSSTDGRTYAVDVAASTAISNP